MSDEANLRDRLRAVEQGVPRNVREELCAACGVARANHAHLLVRKHAFISYDPGGTPLDAAAGARQPMTDETNLRDRLRAVEYELAEAKRVLPPGLALMALPAAVRRLTEDCDFAEQRALKALAQLERIRETR